MKLNGKNASTVAIGTLMFVFLVLLNGITGKETKELIRLVSDSALFVGVIFGGAGILMFCSDMGIFDGLTFGVKKMLSLAFSRSKEEILQDYGTYVNEKHKKKSDNSGLLLTGAIFIGISILAMIAFNI